MALQLALSLCRLASSDGEPRIGTHLLIGGDDLRGQRCYPLRGEHLDEPGIDQGENSALSHGQRSGVIGRGGRVIRTGHAAAIERLAPVWLPCILRPQ
jgi:hypothetical protein